MTITSQVNPIDHLMGNKLKPCTLEEYSNLRLRYTLGIKLKETLDLFPEIS